MELRSDPAQIRLDTKKYKHINFNKLVKTSKTNNFFWRVCCDQCHEYWWV